MDDKFDRIVREPFVMGGQARIRDTNITVNEIVRLSLDGLSQTDILTKYPKLDAEDVHQACIYHAYCVEQRLTVFSPDIRTPLAIIKSNAELVRLKFDKYREFDASYLQKIQNWVIRAEDIVGNLFLALAHVLDTIELQKTETSIVIKAIDEKLNSYGATIAEVQIDNTVANTIIQTQSDLLASVVCGILVEFDPQKSSYLISRQEQKIRFILHKNGENIQHVLLAMQDSHNYQFANYILYKLGSKLDIHESTDGVVFEFELPIWQDEQD